MWMSRVDVAVDPFLSLSLQPISVLASGVLVSLLSLLFTSWFVSHLDLNLIQSVTSVFTPIESNVTMCRCLNFMSPLSSFPVALADMPLSDDTETCHLSVFLFCFSSVSPRPPPGFNSVLTRHLT